MPAVLLYVTIGLVLVLLLRKPARRLFGAAPAFTLWLLPPALAALPWLPAPPTPWSLAPVLSAMPGTQALIQHATSSAFELPWMWLAWATGASALLVRLALGYGRLLRDAQPMPDALWQSLGSELDGLKRGRVRLHASGPAVLWAP
jgi:beta-lactamase regulating signal transducer with metallopeptidase domain